MDYRNLTAEDIAYIFTPASIDGGGQSQIVLLQEDGHGGLETIACPLTVFEAARFFGIDYLPSDKTAINMHTMDSLEDVSAAHSMMHSYAIWKMGASRSIIPLRSVLDIDAVVELNLRHMRGAIKSPAITHVTAAGRA